MTPRRATDKLTIIQLIPNMLTIAALCAGLTAIRLGMQGNFEWAVKLILIAALLDGLDGRIARLLKSDSKMGAELDSLADFLNFGVAPGLILFVWALEDSGSLGWIAVLFFAVCAVLRLARFNVARKDEPSGDNAYFIGIPSPAGAMLVMLPLFVSFALGRGPILPDIFLEGWMGLIGFLMISQIPTWSFKKTRIPRVNVRYFLVAFALVGALVMAYLWTTLVVLSLAYICSVVWGLVRLPRGNARD